MANHTIRPEAPPPTGDDLRQLLLKAVEKCNRLGPSFMQTDAILKAVIEPLAEQGQRCDEQSLLTLYYDLFRTGHLAWGVHLSAPGPPHCHLTERGDRMLAQVSRDPANPAGYLAHLEQHAKLEPIARSYLAEALNAYNNDCYKAASVMVGAAAEALLLGFRDLLVPKLKAATPPLSTQLQKRLEAWQAKTVHDAIAEALGPYRPAMSRELGESFESHWPALAGELRTTRNAAGHPGPIDPITHERAHAALLVFPPFAKLVTELTAWVPANVK